MDLENLGQVQLGLILTTGRQVIKIQNQYKTITSTPLRHVLTATSTIPNPTCKQICKHMSAQGTVGSINCMHQRFRGTIEDEANAHAWAPQHGQVGQISVLRLFVILSGSEVTKCKRCKSQQIKHNQTCIVVVAGMRKWMKMITS